MILALLKTFAVVQKQSIVRELGMTTVKAMISKSLLNPVVLTENVNFY